MLVWRVPQHARFAIQLPSLMAALPLKHTNVAVRLQAGTSPSHTKTPPPASPPSLLPAAAAHHHDFRPALLDLEQHVFGGSKRLLLSYLLALPSATRTSFAGNVEW